MTIARSLISSAALALGVSWAVLGGGCGATEEGDEGVGQAASAVLTEGDTERIRILTWNVWDVSDPSTAVLEQAERVLQHADGFDVVLLNEVFSDSARMHWYNHLKDAFPYALIEVDSSGIDLDDSGLMVLSRLPFEQAPLQGTPIARTGTVDILPEDFKQRMDDAGGIDRFVRFDEFASGSGSDGTKAKGAVIFHVRAGTRLYNIVATNLQKGEDEGLVREQQMLNIETLVMDRINPDGTDETIVAGDFNIDASEPAIPEDLDSPVIGNPAFNPFFSTEYRSAVWTDLAGQPFFDAWRTTSSKDRGFTTNLGRGEDAGSDPDAFKGAHRTDFFLVDGRGYHTPNQATWALGSNIFPNAPSMPRDPRCVSWVRTTLRSASSDHFGVAMEMGPRSPHCNPKLAFPGRQDGVSTTFDLTAPGASAWIHFPNPGTYTLGLGKDEQAQGLAYEVFAEDNLSRGIAAMPKHDEILELTGPACGQGVPDCAFETERFFTGSKGFYVRVFSPTGRTFGQFHFYSRRHDCSSIANACELAPGAAPFVPAVPTDRDFIGHFTFQAMQVINQDVPQTITFDLRTPTPDGLLRLTTTRLGNSGSTPWRPSFHREHIENRDPEYLLRVERSSWAVTYEIGATTNLTWVSGAKDDLRLPLQQAFASPPNAMKLVCQDEGGEDWAGEEEILATLVADGVVVAGPPYLFRNDMDAWEAMDMSRVPDFGFVNDAYLYVQELKDDYYGAEPEDHAVHNLVQLDRHVAGGQERQEPIQLWSIEDDLDGNATAGPLMQFQYHISHGRAR